MKEGDFTSAEMRDSRRTALSLCAVMALGLALRLYRLGDESVYYDEYSSLVFVNAPTLLDFLKLNRVHDPAMAPAYFILQYLWYHFVSPSWYGLRLASIGVGLGVMGVAYAAGKDLAGGGTAGRRAGLLAALLVALSPSHIYFAQEIKNYGLFTLSAAFAAWTLLRAARGDGRKWWLGNAVANTVLMWSHLHGALFLLPQGLFLLSFGPRQWRKWLAWGLVHVMLVLPLGYFISTMKFPDAKGANWLGVPSKKQVLFDVLADDVVRELNIAARQTEAWQRAMSPEAAKAFVGTLAPWLAWLMLILPVAATALALGMGRVRNGKREAFFIMLWFVLPPVILYALTVWWRPCMVPRYTLPASLGVYWILGMGLAAISRARLRTVAFSLLAFLGLWQLSLQFERPYRENWQGVARLLEAQAKPTDLVVVNNDLWVKVLMLCMDRHPYLMQGINSPDDAADQALLYPELAGLRGIGPDTPLRVWAVIPTPFGMAPSMVNPAAGFDRRGIKYEMTEFPGSRFIYVYRVDCPPAGTPPPADLAATLKPESAFPYVALARELNAHGDAARTSVAAERALAINPELGEAWQLLAMARQGQGNLAGAAEAYGKAVECMPDNPWVKVGASLVRFELGDLAGPLAMLEGAAEKLPQDALARYALGIALAGNGRMDEGIAKLKESLALRPDDVTALVSLVVLLRERAHPEDNPTAEALMTQHQDRLIPYAPLFDALYAAQPDTDAVRREMQTLPSRGMGIPPLLRETIRKRAGI